jgi:hypothetical protein
VRHAEARPLRRRRETVLVHPTPMGNWFTLGRDGLRAVPFLSLISLLVMGLAWEFHEPKRSRNFQALKPLRKRLGRKMGLKSRQKQSELILPRFVSDAR